MPLNFTPYNMDILVSKITHDRNYYIYKCFSDKGIGISKEDQAFYLISLVKWITISF